MMRAGEEVFPHAGLLDRTAGRRSVLLGAQLHSPAYGSPGANRLRRLRARGVIKELISIKAQFH